MCKTAHLWKARDHADQAVPSRLYAVVNMTTVQEESRLEDRLLGLATHNSNS